ncbi:helix-turn-helix domain-containing protein [Thomasclavelia ramosa]|uniref:helix-turn-helix domain-containing protein n=1 Tax=Thomasclavelia ramosa TaxID=1547 RepID=UPI00189E45C5|nr:helix-turn-helix transcriptional regulator [Thomasclavelia ramosa]
MSTIIDYDVIGIRIKKRREQLHITQEFMSSQLGITTFYISKIENGHVRPRLDILEEISQFLGMNLVELLFGFSINDEQFNNYMKLNVQIRSAYTEIDKLLKLLQQFNDNIRNK